MTDATLRASGLWLGTWTGAGGTTSLVALLGSFKIVVSDLFGIRGLVKKYMYILTIGGNSNWKG